jgi:hypothetical protein
MSGSNGHGRLLIGKERIREYLGIGEPAFYDFVKMGMPARVINNRWYAHSDNIDVFFKQITGRGMKDVPTDAE